MLSDFIDAISPSQEDALLARESSRRLAKFMSTGKPGRSMSFRIQDDGMPEETVSIPVSAFRLLNDILTQMAQGNAVTLIPIHAELTTQQAADILNVSRPFLVEQLDKNLIPHRKVGKHRRVLFQDLMKYKHEIDQHRRAALNELTAQAEELDLGY